MYYDGALTYKGLDMAVLIVGADYVTSFKHLILAQCHMRVKHWDGRKKRLNKYSLPSETQLIIVICDYVNHSLVNAVKEKANYSDIPLIYCHRSVSELKYKLQRMH